MESASSGWDAFYFAEMPVEDCEELKRACRIARAIHSHDFSQRELSIFFRKYIKDTEGLILMMESDDEDLSLTGSWIGAYFPYNDRIADAFIGLMVRMCRKEGIMCRSYSPEMPNPVSQDLIRVFYNSSFLRSDRIEDFLWDLCIYGSYNGEIFCEAIREIAAYSLIKNMSDRFGKTLLLSRRAAYLLSEMVAAKDCARSGYVRKGLMDAFADILMPKVTDAMITIALSDREYWMRALACRCMGNREERVSVILINRICPSKEHEAIVRQETRKALFQRKDRDAREILEIVFRGEKRYPLRDIAKGLEGCCFKDYIDFLVKIARNEMGIFYDREEEQELACKVLFEKQINIETKIETFRFILQSENSSKDVRRTAYSLLSKLIGSAEVKKMLFDENDSVKSVGE